MEQNSLPLVSVEQNWFATEQVVRAPLQPPKLAPVSAAQT
jgi:hypothetical protein